MNRINRLIACSFLVAAPVFVLAQGNAGQMSQGGMMNQEHMQQMHENMSRMQGMMQQMPNAGSQEERQRLMQEHMESMQEHMGMMRGGMMGPGMMDQGMMGNGQGMMNNQGQKQPGNAQGNRAGGPGMDNEQRMNMMENRMDQMQLMMEQMLEHQRQLNRN
ncbi:hypothetical protein [Marinobacter sp. HN1S83]|uniref:hypothetical protein n=1 Tax=Marinobacter sp. HN1S83 TaxID=3382301 RepID=UPI00387AC6F2